MLGNDLRVDHVVLRDFRNYVSAELGLPPTGLTVLCGPNGGGKTNLLEAVGYISSLKSFRGAPVGALVRAGAPFGVVGAEVSREGRRLDLEAEVVGSGRGRLKVNGRLVRRREEFVGRLLVTVLSPDDIGIVTGEPGDRRDWLDAVAMDLWPGYEVTLAMLERALRQRNAILRSAEGVLRPGMAGVLDVWETKLAEAGEAVARTREALVGALMPEVARAYERLGGSEGVTLAYERSWEGGLGEALRQRRPADLARGSTSVGPQRDDVQMALGGLPARTQASRGQQRGLALALRLGSHAVVAQHHGTEPVLLLDDIFSELDPLRSSALASGLPAGQGLLALAGPVPTGLAVATTVKVVAGSLGVASSLVPGRT